MARRSRPAYTPAQIETLRHVYEGQLLTAACLILSADENCTEQQAAEQACDAMEALLDHLSNVTIEE